MLRKEIQSFNKGTFICIYNQNMKKRKSLKATCMKLNFIKLN